LDAHALFLSRCVCASGLCVVLVAVRCSISCFVLGREKCSMVLVVISTSSSSTAALSVYNMTQSLWRTHTINEGSGSGGKFRSRSSYC
jgi:hypothetical protein